MSKREVLEKAIRKAVKNGWELPFEGRIETVDIVILTLPNTDQQIPLVCISIEGSPGLYFTIYDLLYSHNFAKALWGEDQVGINEAGKLWKGARAICIATQPFWQYHLQQMVIADDPIKYLGENL